MAGRTIYPQHLSQYFLRDLDFHLQISAFWSSIIESCEVAFLAKGHVLCPNCTLQGKSIVCMNLPD